VKLLLLFAQNSADSANDKKNEESTKTNPEEVSATGPIALFATFSCTFVIVDCAFAIRHRVSALKI
jgi:hypothetical protein